MGIGPTYSAWKAAALPLCYTRTGLLTISLKILLKWWKGLDSNQRTQKRTDLQSVGFNHSPTYPQGALRSSQNKEGILCRFFVALSSLFLYNERHGKCESSFYRL